MRDATADSANKINQSSGSAEAATALDGRYRDIGILAVVAAVRYQGSAKNPAYAPSSTAWRDRIAEAAA